MNESHRYDRLSHAAPLIDCLMQINSLAFLIVDSSKLFPCVESIKSSVELKMHYVVLKETKDKSDELEDVVVHKALLKQEKKEKENVVQENKELLPHLQAATHVVEEMQEENHSLMLVLLLARD